MNPVVCELIRDVSYGLNVFEQYYTEKFNSPSVGSSNVFNTNFT